MWTTYTLRFKYAKDAQSSRAQVEKRLNHRQKQWKVQILIKQLLELSEAIEAAFIKNREHEPKNRNKAL